MDDHERRVGKHGGKIRQVAGGRERSRLRYFRASDLYIVT
jgi:hypothetical protein